MGYQNPERHIQGQTPLADQHPPDDADFSIGWDEEVLNLSSRKEALRT